MPRGGVQTNWEGRLRWLEREGDDLRRRLKVAEDLARAAMENALRDPSSAGGGSVGVRIYRALVTTAIPAPANATANATNAGRATIQVMDKATGAWSTHPDFATPQVIWNGWPGASTTATVGKVIRVSYQDGIFTIEAENCT